MEFEVDVVSTMIANMAELESFSLERFGGARLLFSTEPLLALGGLTKLKELCIHCYRHLVDTSILQAWADGFGSQLEILDLTKNDGVNQIGLLALIKKASGLRILEVDSMDAACLEAVASGCPLLEDLMLGGTNVQSERKGIQAIVEKCLKLKRIRTWNRYHDCVKKYIKAGKFRNIRFDVCNSI